MTKLPVIPISFMGVARGRNNMVQYYGSSLWCLLQVYTYSTILEAIRAEEER